MAVLTPGSVVKISGAPVAGEQLVEELTYTAAQIDEAVRLTLTPGHLAAQLYEVSSPIATPYTTADTSIPLAGADSLELIVAQDFGFDEGNTRFFYDKSGAVDTTFNLIASLSFSQDIQNPDAEVILRATKNGTPIEGIYTQRTIRTANTVGVIALSGHLTLSDTDYVEIYVESTKTGTFNAWSFATSIIEEAH
jgi:hypothetical protein